MNPIFALNSENVSALPAAGPVAGLSPRGAGGFAATLAAAQGTDAAAQDATAEATTANSAPSAADPTNTNPAISTAKNSPAKKSPGSGPTISQSGAAAANFIAPTTTARPVPILGSGTNFSPTGYLPPPIAVNRVIVTDGASGSAASGDASAATLMPFSTLAPTGGTTSQASLPAIPEPVLPSPNIAAAQTQNVPNVKPVQLTAVSSVSAIPDSTKPILASANANSVRPVNISESASTRPVLLAGNTQSDILPFSSGQSLAGDGSARNIAVNNEPSVMQAQSFAATSDAAQPAVSLANALSPAVAASPISTPLPLNTSGTNVPEDQPSATPTSNNNISTDEVWQNAPAANVNAQAPAQAILSALGQPLSNETMTRLPAVKTGAVPIGGVRKTAQATGSVSAGTSASASSLASASTSDDDSPAAGQTPFSVFFSSTGLGVESAATTLPKMVVPLASAHSGPAVGGAGNPGTNASTGAPGNTAPNAAPQSAKEAIAGSPVGAAQTVQPIHTGTDASAGANAAAIAAQSSTPPTASAPAAGAVTLPAPGPATSLAGALPPQNTPPGNSLASSSAPASLPVEVPATVPPGPVQVAQMVNRVGQAEMRIGMNTSTFGSVEVRTVVHVSDVGVTIGSEKGDLRGLMASELPAISNSLQQQNLRLSGIHFMPGQDFSNPSSSGGGSQQRSFVPAPPGPQYASSAEGAVEDSPEAPGFEYGGMGGGLSILA